MRRCDSGEGREPKFRHVCEKKDTRTGSDLPVALSYSASVKLNVLFASSLLFAATMLQVIVFFLFSVLTTISRCDLRLNDR